MMRKPYFSSLSFTKFIIGFSFSFFLFLSSYYYYEKNGLYSKCVVLGVQRDPKRIISDFTKGSPRDIVVEARSNDTLVFKCRMDAGTSRLTEFDEYKTKRFCFPYVLDIFMKVQDIYFLIPGSTDLKYNMDEESKIIESEITFPPVIASPVFFRCPCFMKYNEKYLEKTLYVHLFPNYPLTFELIGCNFTTIYNHPLGEGAFNVLQKLDPAKGQKICTVDINTHDDRYISLLCPKTHELDPPNCIKEDVYIYKNEQDEKKEKIININDEAELVSINSKFGFKFIEEATTDKHSLFGIFDFPGSLPELIHPTVYPLETAPPKIPNKVSFFCTCNKKEHGTITEMLRMNVHFDTTEKIKEIGRHLMKPPVKEPEPLKKKEKDCLDKLNVCLGVKNKVHPEGGVISPPTHELNMMKPAITPPDAEPNKGGSPKGYGQERRKVPTMADVLKEYGLDNLEEGMDVKDPEKEEEGEEDSQHHDAEEHLKGFKKYNELDLYSVGSSCGILHSAVSLGFVIFVMMMRNESF